MHPPSPARGSARGRGVLFFIIKQKQILEAIYDTVIWVINCEQQFKFKYSSQARLCSTPELVGHPAPFQIMLDPSLYWLGICSREAKNKSWQCDWSAKNFATKCWISSYFFTVRANKFAYWKMGLIDTESL
jgi:hypothetical protein